MKYLPSSTYRRILWTAAVVAAWFMHGSANAASAVSPVPTDSDFIIAADPAACGGASYCGFAGDATAKRWYYPNCATLDCGTETWYVGGLPVSVGKATIVPPVTTGAQVVTITITLAAAAPVGTYSITLGANCSGSVSCLPGTVALTVLQKPAITLSRSELTIVVASAAPDNGTFTYAVNAVTGTAIPTVDPTTTTNNPNVLTLTSPGGSGAPRPGARARITADYNLPLNGRDHKAKRVPFQVPTFGLSCYYTALQGDWGAPGSCRKVTINGVTYSGTAKDPYGLAGTYCRSFMEIVKLNGSGQLNDGRFIQYNAGAIGVVPSINGADGTPVVANQTVARDRSIIPLGRTVDIDDVGNGLTANDTGAAIAGYRIDLYRGAGRAVCNGYSNPIQIAACQPASAGCPKRDIP